MKGEERGGWLAKTRVQQYWDGGNGSCPKERADDSLVPEATPAQPTRPPGISGACQGCWARSPEKKTSRLLELVPGRKAQETAVQRARWKSQGITAKEGDLEAVRASGSSGLLCTASTRQSCYCTRAIWIRGTHTTENCTTTSVLFDGSK